MYFANENINKLEATLTDLDNRPTAVFQSVAGCIKIGGTEQACKASQKEALDISGSLGTTASYSSNSECVTAHRACQKVVTPITTTVFVNNVPLTTTTYSISYHPPVVAWQAATDDLYVSVPLYSGPENGTAVRWDGLQFNIK